MTKDYWRKNSKTYNRIPLTAVLFLLLSLTLLSACGEQGARQTDYFIPPTLAPQASPITINSPTPVALVTPTPTLTCTNSLSFIDDVTVPDGTAFAPNAAVEKVWLVENSGTCNWEEGYQIRLTSGEAMGVEAEQALFPARSGAQAEIQITFTAPSEPGRYKSVWQAYTPEGAPFGDPFYLDIIVSTEE